MIITDAYINIKPNSMEGQRKPVKVASQTKIGLTFIVPGRVSRFHQPPHKQPPPR